MKKVIIIGAGPAGITAANELLKDTKGEYDVTILEETERIGGISQTVRYNGNRLDIGGSNAVLPVTSVTSAPLNIAFFATFGEE